MKKQIKKLNLNKRTISNLNTGEMNLKVGGGPVDTRKCYTEHRCTQGCNLTLNGHTCGGGNNC